MTAEPGATAQSGVDRTLQVYAVKVVFNVEGAPFELDSGLQRSEPEDLTDDEAGAGRIECEAEVSKALKPFCDALQRLGCISVGPEDDGDAPLFFLVTEGDWDPPQAPLLWDPQGPLEIVLGSKSDHALHACPGAKLAAHAWAEEIDLADAYARLRQLGPGHELSCWGGERTLDRLPMDDDSAEKWAARNAVPAAYMDTLGKRLTLFNFDVGMAFSFPSPSISATPVFIVDKLLPLGDVASLVARSGVGKTSFCHQLAAVAAAPVREHGRKAFLGRDVPGQFWVAFLSGEEAPWYFVARQERFERLWPGGMCGIIRPEMTREDLPAQLAELASFSKRAGERRGVAIIDSAQSFLGGDDTKAHVASQFYQMLRDWAQSTGWAVLIIHHTVKTPAHSLAQFRTSVRGSSVHVDMPRNVFAMIDRGANLVGFGTVKSNLPPDVAWLREGQEVLCERRPETHTFELISSVDSCGTAASGDDIERVASAISEANATGMAVHKSGKGGLYERRFPNLVGLSRNFIQQAINSLISIGRVEVTKSGLILKNLDGTTGEDVRPLKRVAVQEFSHA